MYVVLRYRQLHQQNQRCQSKLNQGELNDELNDALRLITYRGIDFIEFLVIEKPNFNTLC